MRLEGRVALVTGSSTGIGRATALMLADHGADVAVNYCSSEAEALRVVGAIREKGRKAVAVKADVANKKEVGEMVRRIGEALGVVDILINNAGTLVARASIADMPEELWDRAMDINLKGVFLCCQAVIPEMVKRGYGRIVNIASVGAFTGGGGGGVHYVAAKGGVIAFTKGLAMELAPHGIRVNAIAPGVIDTPFQTKFSTPEAVAGRVSKLPLGRSGKPDEVARAVLFLVDDECAYMTGQTLVVDGGMVFR